MPILKYANFGRGLLGFPLAVWKAPAGRWIVVGILVVGLIGFGVYVALFGFTFPPYLR